MDAVLDALGRIEAWLAAHAPRVAAALRPPLPRATVEALTAGLPCRLPEEVYALYGWHDGTEEVAGSFIWYHDFLPLEVALDAYRQLLASDAEVQRMLAADEWYQRRVAAGEEAPEHPFWDPAWFPLFAFQGEYYLVDCGGPPGQPAPVRYFFGHYTEHPVVCADLAALLQTAAAWYERGAVWVDDPETGALDDDLPRVRNIHQELNPGLPFPYRVPEG